MKGLDLRKLKKMSTDGKTTTFKHADGHEIKIAHSGLSKQMKVDLDKIPCSEKPKMMAEGGDAEPSGWDKFKNDISSAAGDVSSYWPKNENLPEYGDNSNAWSPQNNQAPAPMAPTPPQSDVAAKNSTPEAPPVAATDEAIPNEAPPEQTAAPDEGLAARAPATTTPSPVEAAPQEQAPPPEQTAPEQASNDYKQSFQETKAAHQKEFAQQDVLFQQDLQNGHITPETYHDLFAKKDTLGKIGTIFGLLTAGIGSGLTGQPNALLGMMNNEIQNDLNAQINSKTNAQNFIKLNQNQQLNAATIENMKKQGQLTDVQAKSMMAEANLKNFTLSNLAKNQAALHEQAVNVAKMPEGPLKEQAKQALAMMGTAVTNENARISDIAASKMALMSQLNDSGNSGEKGFQNQQTFLRMTGNDKIADFKSARHIPNVGQASAPVPENKKDELEAMNVLDYKANDLLNFAKAHKGTISPSQRAIGAQKAEELLNYYNSSIKGGVLTEGRLKWLDEQIKKNPTSVFQDILGNNSRLTEIRDSNAQRKNIMLKNMGAPEQQSAPSQPSQSKSGKPMIQKNGKWYYQ